MSALSTQYVKDIITWDSHIINIWIPQQNGSYFADNIFDYWTKILIFLVKYNKILYVWVLLPKLQLMFHAVYHQVYCIWWGQFDVKYSGELNISNYKIFLVYSEGSLQNYISDIYLAVNRMAWQWAETLVRIRGTLADIRGTTK